MSLIVCKFGGSSVQDPTSLKRVASRLVRMKKYGHDVVVVVSAMGDTTDELLDLATQVAGLQAHPTREMDILLTAGERISMALLAMALEAQGVSAHSYTGPQAGLMTDGNFGQARIVGIEPKRIKADLERSCIPIVAGFQGFHAATFDTTTLGRGGSDTTAVALAHALGADICEIYTDVDGVFSADPRVVPKARLLKEVTAEEMLELAAHGSKVLHVRAIEFARRHGVKVRVRSSFSDMPGTLITASAERNPDMEDALVSGISTDRSQAKVTVVGVPDSPGAAATLFERVAASGVNVDMVVQNVSAVATGLTDISFTVAKGDAEALLPGLERLVTELGAQGVLVNSQIGILSVVGAGVRSHPGVYAQVFGALRDACINIEMISASEMRISVVMGESELDRAARVVHETVGLDAESGEAVVYAGTGR